jgi:hypothetical protein
MKGTFTAFQARTPAVCYVQLPLLFVMLCLFCSIDWVGQNRILTPYMTVYLGILPAKDTVYAPYIYGFG